MHTVKIEISEQAFEKVMYLLKSLPKKDVKIISKKNTNKSKNADIKMLANHSANLIEDWKDASEDEIWM